MNNWIDDPYWGWDERPQTGFTIISQEAAFQLFESKPKFISNFNGTLFSRKSVNQIGFVKCSNEPRQ